MNRRILVASLGLAGLLALLTMSPAPLDAQAGRGSQAPVEVPRAIRRDVPMTNSIRRAFDAGTRNLTGRPGSNYWQIQTDYTISARLDPGTDTITGTETIALHNTSPQEMTEIALRLDHNIFREIGRAHV